MTECLESNAKDKCQKEIAFFVLLFMTVEETVGVDFVEFDPTREENLKVGENFRRMKRKRWSYGS